MPGEWTPAILQLGASGILLLVVWMIVRDGSLRTRFELEAEANRRKRAEDQVDTLLPALKEQTATVQRMSDGFRQISEALAANSERMDRLAERMRELIGREDPLTDRRRLQPQRLRREDAGE